MKFNICLLVKVFFLIVYLYVNIFYLLVRNKLNKFKSVFLFSNLILKILYIRICFSICMYRDVNCFI